MSQWWSCPTRLVTCRVFQFRHRSRVDKSRTETGQELDRSGACLKSPLTLQLDYVFINRDGAELGGGSGVAVPLGQVTPVARAAAALIDHACRAAPSSAASPPLTSVTRPCPGLPSPPRVRPPPRANRHPASRYEPVTERHQWRSLLAIRPLSSRPAVRPPLSPLFSVPLSHFPVVLLSCCPCSRRVPAVFPSCLSRGPCSAGAPVPVVAGLGVAESMIELQPG